MRKHKIEYTRLGEVEELGMLRFLAKPSAELFSFLLLHPKEEGFFGYEGEKLGPNSLVKTKN